jgi:hypothetical protein
MRFVKRHRYVLGFLAVLLLCSVMVQWQVLRNQSRRVQMREDFIMLQQRGHVKPAERFYQLLVQSLPEQQDKCLLEDFQRTAMLVDTNKAQLDSLIWKYHISVRNEIKQRTEKRVAKLLKEFKE